MTALCVTFFIWAIIATYGWFHCHRAAQEWRTQFMIERGCDTLETRKWMSDTKSKTLSDLN